MQARRLRRSGPRLAMIGTSGPWVAPRGNRPTRSETAATASSKRLSTWQSASSARGGSFFPPRVFSTGRSGQPSVSLLFFFLSLPAERARKTVHTTGTKRKLTPCLESPSPLLAALTTARRTRKATTATLSSSRTVTLAAASCTFLPSQPRMVASDGSASSSSSSSSSTILTEGTCARFCALQHAMVPTRDLARSDLCRRHGRVAQTRVPAPQL